MVCDEIVEAARNAFIGRWNGIVPFDTKALDADIRAALEAVAPAILDQGLVAKIRAGEIFTLGKVASFCEAARTQALEEAARIAEAPTDKPARCREDIAADIRAMKEPT